MSEAAALSLWDYGVPKVKLRHVIYVTNGLIHFNDGSLRTKQGVVEVPLSKPDWLITAWREGYRLTEDGQPVPADIVSWANRPVEPAKPAKRGRTKE